VAACNVFRTKPIRKLSTMDETLEGYMSICPAANLKEHSSHIRIHDTRCIYNLYYKQIKRHIPTKSDAWNITE
jgi:hypothetical protein